MNDSEENDTSLARVIKQQNEQRVRKARVSTGRVTESMYRNENEDDHDNQTRSHGLSGRGNFDFIKK